VIERSETVPTTAERRSEDGSSKKRLQKSLKNRAIEEKIKKALAQKVLTIQIPPP
jgi:hypothetical protein